MSYKDDKVLTPDLEGGKSSSGGTRVISESAEAGVSSTAGTLLVPEAAEAATSSDDDVSSAPKGNEAGKSSRIDIPLFSKGVEAGISSRGDSTLVLKVQAEGSSGDETPLALALATESAKGRASFNEGTSPTPEGAGAPGSTMIDIPQISTGVKAEGLLSEILLTHEGTEAGGMPMTEPLLRAESDESVDESVGIKAEEVSGIDVLSAFQDVSARTWCGFNTQSESLLSGPLSGPLSFLKPISSSKVRWNELGITLAPESMETGGPSRIHTPLTAPGTEGGGPSRLDVSLSLSGTEASGPSRLDISSASPGNEIGGPLHRGGSSSQDRTDDTRELLATLQQPEQDTAAVTIDEIRDRKGKKKVED